MPAREPGREIYQMQTFCRFVFTFYSRGWRRVSQRKRFQIGRKNSDNVRILNKTCATLADFAGTALVHLRFCVRTAESAPRKCNLLHVRNRRYIFLGSPVILWPRFDFLFHKVRLGGRGKYENGSPYIVILCSSRLKRAGFQSARSANPDSGFSERG